MQQSFTQADMFINLVVIFFIGYIVGRFSQTKITISKNLFEAEDVAKEVVRIIGEDDFILVKERKENDD